MVHKGDADGMICGTFGIGSLHLFYINQVLGKRPGVNVYAAMNGLYCPIASWFWLIRTSTKI